VDSNFKCLTLSVTQSVFDHSDSEPGPGCPSPGHLRPSAGEAVAAATAGATFSPYPVEVLVDCDPRDVPIVLSLAVSESTEMDA
jgi:hypothetical protein